MNSLDGIIAICALIGGYAILLGAIIEQKNNYNETKDTLEANSIAIKCETIIDGIYSNSAEKYVGEINCQTDKNTIKAEAKKKIKILGIITEAKKTNVLEVKTQPHYQN